LFLDKIVFSDEATFRIPGVVNRHNLIIWGSQNPPQVVEHVRDSSKINVFCTVSITRVYGSFFFSKLPLRVTCTSIWWSIPVPQLDVNSMIWQKDGAHSHYNRDFTLYLNHTFPGRWIGRGRYIPWPHKSPAQTLMGFSFRDS
jgi:hypothetical protein